MKLPSKNKYKNSFLIYFSILINFTSYAQTTQTDKVIESGKLLLDIFKTIKSSGANDPKTNENKINKTESKSNTIKKHLLLQPI